MRGFEPGPQFTVVIVPKTAVCQREQPPWQVDPQVHQNQIGNDMMGINWHHFIDGKNCQDPNIF